MPRVEVKDAEILLYSMGKLIEKPIPHYEFDVQDFRDPGAQKQFKGVEGTSQQVQEWIKDDRRLPAILQQVEFLASDLIDAQKNKWLTLGFRDFHGKYISPAVTEIIATRLVEKGYKVSVVHLGYK